VITPAVEVTTRVEGASPQQRSVLLKILSGLGPTSVRTIELVPATEDQGARGGAIEMNFEISPDDRLASWHAQLIARAFRQGSLDRRLPPVVFFNAGNSGETLESDAASRRVVPSLTLAQAKSLSERIGKAAIRNNANVRRLELLRPRGFAFSVVLQADDPADFLFRGLDEVTEPLDSLGPRAYDGRWIEVLERRG
jgi:hypothetical protein